MGFQFVILISAGYTLFPPFSHWLNVEKVLWYFGILKAGFSEVLKVTVTMQPHYNNIEDYQMFGRFFMIHRAAFNYKCPVRNLGLLFHMVAQTFSLPSMQLELPVYNNKFCS